MNLRRCIFFVLAELGNETIDDFSRDVGEAVASTLVFEGKFFMIESHEVEDGGVEIVDVDGVPDDVVAEVVGLAIYAGFYAAAGHPDGKAAGVVVAAIVLFGEGTLAIVCAAEFAAPDDEGLVEQTALFEIEYERGGGLVGVFALSLDLHGQVIVAVPALVIELHEAHAALGEFSCEQAIGGERAGHEAFGSI